MNIPNSNGQQGVARGDLKRIDTASQAKPKSKQISAPAGQTPDIRHQPDSGLAELVSRLSESNSVRQDVVAAAQQQVSSGELLSRETAEQTAGSILGIIKHF